MSCGCSPFALPGPTSTSSHRSSRPCIWPSTHRVLSPRQHGRLHPRRRAVERDLDWEPEVAKGPLMAPNRSGARPPPPPPPPLRTKTEWFEVPFSSRRNILLTMLGGTAALWYANHRLPANLGDKPDVPFNLLGATDLGPEDFQYFKTPGGNWMAAAEDDQGRLFMIDQIGDLYYDSGDPQIGLYAMDTRGNLFNFYVDVDNEQKITPVGNVSDLRKFKISSITGVKLDNDVNVVAFEDGRRIPLPPNAGYVDKKGNFVAPGEVIEGFEERARDGPFTSMFSRSRSYNPQRMEVDVQDPKPFDRQMFEQTLLDDPDLPGFQPALPDDFDLDKLAEEVAQEARDRKR